MYKNNRDNIESLNIVAHRLGNLLKEFTFVGGATLGLLITDKAAPEVRATDDIDCIIEVIPSTRFYQLENQLRDKGFKQNPVAEGHFYRWECDGTNVDIVNAAKKNMQGFTNQWYTDTIKHATQRKISDDITYRWQT